MTDTAKRIEEIRQRQKSALAGAYVASSTIVNLIRQDIPWLLSRLELAEKLAEALETIAEKSVLVMDDLGEDVGDAMAKVAKAALAAYREGERQ